MAYKRYGRHVRRNPRSVAVWVAPLLILVCLACLAVWYAGSVMSPTGASHQASGSGDGDEPTAILERESSPPDPVERHPGNSPDCPDTDCIAVMVNGDLLFHPNLWVHFAGADTTATDGTAFDFDPLFELMGKYIDASDIAICEFETPVAERGGPYSGYPVFSIPPEVADAAANVGYRACTMATNHSWDQGAAGISRLSAELDGNGILHTGAYETEEESTKPLLVESPTGGGTIGLVAGTVSLNGMTADYDWRVDRLRDFGDPNHESDIERAVDKASKAREQGADVVLMAMHSLQEYLDYADGWQVAEAHELADTGAFDVIYGAGCHCAQPVEYYNDTWIIYGLGNTVTVDAPAERIVNNQGVTARIQFAGRRGVDDSWRVSRIDWLPTANKRQGDYQWCPLAGDKPDGACWSDDVDEQVRQRIWNVVYSMDADPAIVQEWRISDE